MRPQGTESGGRPPRGAAGEASRAGPAPRSAREALGWLLEDVPGLIGDRVRIFSLELRRVRLSAGQVALLGAAAAILGLTAWLAAWVLLAVALHAGGLSWAAALAIVLAINALGAWLALRRIAALARAFTFPATLRSLGIAEAPARQPAPAAPENAARPL
jgi:hypothetical protein